jgi:ATP-dependent Zn protease
MAFRPVLLKGSAMARVRQQSALYTQASKSPAAIVFIDEIDSIGANQLGPSLGSVAEQNSTSYWLSLDGLGRSNVVTIGATNMRR